MEWYDYRLMYYNLKGKAGILCTTNFIIILKVHQIPWHWKKYDSYGSQLLSFRYVEWSNDHKYLHQSSFASTALLYFIYTVQWNIWENTARIESGTIINFLASGGMFLQKMFIQAGLVKSRNVEIDFFLQLKNWLLGKKCNFS